VVAHSLLHRGFQCLRDCVVRVSPWYRSGRAGTRSQRSETRTLISRASGVNGVMAQYLSSERHRRVVQAAGRSLVLHIAVAVRFPGTRQPPRTERASSRRGGGGSAGRAEDGPGHAQSHEGGVGPRGQVSVESPESESQPAFSPEDVNRPRGRTTQCNHDSPHARTADESPPAPSTAAALLGSGVLHFVMPKAVRHDRPAELPGSQRF